MPTETPIKIEVLWNAHQQKRNGVRDTIGQCCTCSGHVGRGLSEGHLAEEAEPPSVAMRKSSVCSSKTVLRRFSSCSKRSTLASPAVMSAAISAIDAFTPPAVQPTPSFRGIRPLGQRGEVPIETVEDFQTHQIVQARPHLLVHVLRIKLVEAFIVDDETAHGGQRSKASTHRSCDVGPTLPLFHFDGLSVHGHPNSSVISPSNNQYTRSMRMFPLIGQETSTANRRCG